MIFSVKNIRDTSFDDILLENAFFRMSKARQAKAENYRHKEDKRLCVFSDMLLRDMLKEHFGIDNPDFSTDENGKPIILNSNIFFNISHSKNFIACAVDTKPVGIDIEIYREISSAVTNRVCTEDELKFIFANAHNIQDAEATKRFFMVWTAKEAYLKYSGKGLSGGLKNIVVADSSGLKLKPDSSIYLTNIVTSEYSLSVVSENPQTKI